MDKDRFFRKATLKICGTLDVDRALHQCLLFIREVIPADGMSLSVYDPGSGVSKMIVGARLEGGAILNIETPQPPESRTVIEAWYRHPDRVRHVRIIEDMRLDPVMAPVARSVGLTGGSALHMRLKLEGQMLGSLTAVADESGRFDESHARLLALLNEPFAVALSNYLRFGDVVRLRDLLADDNRYLQDELRRAAGEDIVGADFGLRGVMEMVRQVAPLDSPVILLGETGAGKEVIAGAVHASSPRAGGPFIKVNCGAIPDTLLDSELFGHEKGAFTGAVSRKRGRFERADGGTIFLDEVGELPPAAQVRLLRVLQDREIERVGGTKPLKLNIRIVAATHRNLDEMAADGRLREDLYFRLNVFPIRIPPLRERKSDIPALIHYFVQKKSREMGRPVQPGLAPDVLAPLMDYHWPGNVRELENTVERALILNHGGPLSFPDLRVPSGTVAVAPDRPGVPGPLELDAVVSIHIREVLRMTRGRIHGPDGAARILKINPSTLRKRMTKLGIPFGRGVSYG